MQVKVFFVIYVISVLVSFGIYRSVFHEDVDHQRTDPSLFSSQSKYTAQTSSSTWWYSDPLSKGHKLLNPNTTSNLNPAVH